MKQAIHHQTLRKESYKVAWAPALHQVEYITHIPEAIDIVF